MGFKAYRVDEFEAGICHLTDGMPVRFSGPTGLVALWCRAHKDAVDQPWRVSPLEWLAMMLPVDDARHRWLVLEQEEDGVVSYSQLLSITGVISKKVDLMFTLAPLIVERPSPELSVRRAEDGRLWSEELALDGGPFSTTCTWRWTKPHLALGAAVIGRPLVAAH